MLRLSVRASTPPPLPLLAQYSATKGYVENFTRSLAVEYAGKGVHFQCQSPYFVATAMTFPNSKVRPYISLVLPSISPRSPFYLRHDLPQLQGARPALTLALALALALTLRC